MDGIGLLHDLIVKAGYYSKSVDEFRSQIKDPEYRAKVESVLQKGNLLTDDIKNILSSGETPMAPDPLKKKGQTMESSSEDGSLVSQGLSKPKPYDLYASVAPSLGEKRQKEQADRDESYDLLYRPFLKPEKEGPKELPKSFQNLDYSKGITSEEGIQDLFGQIKGRLKDAPVEDIVSFGNIAAEKVKEGKGSLTPFSQSSVGKVGSWINDIDNGIEISPEDEKRWKEISPKSYNEILSKSPVGKQITPTDISFEPATSVNEIARINKKNNQDKDTKSSYEDVLSSAQQLQSLGIDVANIGNVSTRNEMDKVQAMYDSKFKELQEKYPIKKAPFSILVKKAEDLLGIPERDEQEKYEEELAKLNNAKEYLLGGISKIHSVKYALANPNATSEQIGLEVLKIIDPTTYKNYLKGGSESADVKSDIDRLGIQVLKSTNNQSLINKGIEAEDAHDKKYPDDIVTETKRRLAVERAKDKGLSYIVNSEAMLVSEADKYADQLQGKYKKAYMEIVRPQALNAPETKIMEDWYGAKKNDALINLPPMGGAANSLLGGFLIPVKGTYDFFADRVMPEKFVINKALAKNRDEFVNEDEVKRQINSLLAKKDFTISDAKELDRLNGELKTQIPYKRLVDGTFELTGQVLGQAVLTEMGAGVVSSGARTTSIGSKLIGLRNTATAVTKIARNAELVKDISGMAIGGISSYSDAQKEAIKLGLEGWQQNLYSATVAGLNIATERIFPDEKVFQAFMKDMSPLVNKMVRDMSTSSISESVLSSEIKKILLSVAPKYVGKFALENQKEAIEEVLTQLGTSVAKGILAPDKTNMSDEVNAMKQTYLETTAFGTLTAGIAAAKETKINSINTRSLFTLGQSSKDVQQFIDIVNQRVANGDITQEDADKKIKAATNIRDIVQKSIPAINQKKPLTDAEKIKLSSVLLAERTLKEDIANPQLEDVKSINQKQLQKVTDLKDKILNDEVIVSNDLNAYTPEEYKQKVKEDAIQEQTAGEVPVQPTAGVGEKVEEGVPEPKPVLTPEQKSEKEDRQLKLEKAIEVAPEDATEVKIDDEVIPIKDAKNELETIKVELQPPAITQEEQAATEKKLAKEEKMKTTTFMDEDGNERTIEGNELMFSDLYEEAVNTPEKERTDYQNSILDAMDEVSLETPIQMHDEQQANEFEQKAKDPLHKLIASQAKNVISTLKSMMPNLEFNIHEDEDSYNGNMVRLNGIRGSRGNFSVDKNGKLRIDINLSKVNKLTVFHEAAHAVMYHTFGENYKAFKFFHNKLANAISSMGDQDFIGSKNEITTTKKYLNNFISRYKDKKVRPEEYMVELGSMLSNNAIKLSVDGWRKIALAIREFVKEKTGGKINLFKNINDTKEVVDFFNSMAESFKTGEAMKQAPESFVKRFGKGEEKEGSSSSLKDEIDVKAIRLKDRPGKKVSKGLSVYQKNGKKIIEESEDLSIEYVKKNAPEVFISNSKILASFPLVAGVKKFGEIKTVEQAQEVYDIFTNQIAENLKFLMNNYPEKYRDISTLWYDGANIIAQNESKENDITVEQAAGIIASLSPQKDWYQNVRLAQLVGMAFKENPPMTDKMIEKQKSIVKEGLKPKQKSLEKAQEKYKKSKSNKNLKALEKQKKSYLKYINSSNEIIDALTSYLGKNLNDVPDYIKPYMVRLHHEINTSKDYRVLRPDGVPMDFALKKDGKTRAKLAWGSYSEIGKAVSIYLNGSPENITRALGEMHKIRNFNNNIVDPMSEDYDVTMDTHAIAAALLMPLSGNSKQVEQNFGKDTSNSDLFGIKGLYYAYAEGYKKAAQDVGLLPRQVQSITWEAVRGLFTDVFKRNKDEVEKINKIWSNYENKKITIDEAREQIIESAGGINPPTWSAEGGGLVQEGVGENVEKGSVRRGGEKPKRNTVGDKSGGAGKRGVTKSKAQISQEDKRLVQTISKSSLVGSRAKLAESIMRDKEKAIKLEKLNMPANEIRLITNWEKGADGKWRYELDSSKSKIKLAINSKDDLKKEYKLSDVIDYPELFKAYPELKDVKFGYSKVDSQGIPMSLGEGSYDPYGNKIILGYTDDIFEKHPDSANAPKLVIDIAKKEIKLDEYAMSLERKGIEPYSPKFMDKIDKYEEKLGIDRQALVDAGYGTMGAYGVFEPNQKYQNIILDLGAENSVENTIRKVSLHEIQHIIQEIEDFARGGNASMAKSLMSKSELKEYQKIIAQIIQINEDIDEGRITVDDLTPEQRKIYTQSANGFTHEIYKRISGEVEARNVEARMNMTAEERRRTPLAETEDRPRNQHKFVQFEKNKSKSELAKSSVVSKAQLTEEELPGYDDMMSEVKNIIEKVLKRQMDRLGKTISRDTNLDNAKYRKERLDAAINYVMQDSKIYADADDVQREQIVRDIRKLLKFKEKSAPGNKSELFMGIGRIIKMAKKEKMVTMTAYKLLLKEMNALARGARDARVAMNKSRNYIADSLRFYVRSGQLSSRQAAAILRMYSKTNLLKPESVERLIGYMVKVFRDADYAQKLSTANSLRSKIVQQMKDKTKSPDLRAMAMKFANIETSLVEDIDEYNKVASNLLSGISGSKKRGEKINWAEGVDLLGLSNYINNAMESQNKQKRDMLENEMKVIMGLDTSDMPYGDLNMFNNDDSEQEKSIAIAKKLNQFGVDTTGMTYKQMRSSLIKETIKRAFGINLDDGTYPGSFSNEQKKTMKDFLDSDLDNLSDKEAMDAVNKLTAEMKGLNYIDLSDMSYEELKAVMEGDKEEETNEEKKKKRGIVSKIIDDIVKRAFSVNSSVISSMIENGKDPLTGDPVDFTEKQKDILKRFMDMDLDLLSEKQRIEAVDKLNLFVQNQGDYRSTAGMESILAVHDAEKNLRTLAEEGVYAHVIRKYFSPRMGRLLLENIVSVPMMFERLFKGVTRGAMVQDMSGTTDMINGKAKAERMSRKMDTAYVLKFFKKKPNGESFNTAKNNIERGMGAYMMRNIVGTEEEMRKEFERRRGIIEKSIALLEQGDDNEKQKAEMYQEAYDKIVKDSKNIGDIKSKIDPINLEAIEWWSSMWDEHYEEMAGVTANVYNQILEKDINYNPDRFKVISTDRNPAQLTSNKSIFNFNNGTMYRQEAGSLKTPLRSSALPVNEESGEANRYIDFSFDNNNSNAMYDALVDINTAAAATKLNAFIDSKNFGKLFKSSKDKDIVRDRLIMMANNMRNKSPFTNRGEAEKLIHSLNRIASVGVGQALGGVFQPLKQMGPVALNTLINAGGLHLGLIFDPKRMDFINRSGYAIANRGSDASTQIASLNKIIKEAAESKGEKAIRFIEKANRLQLEIFLVQPDVYIAKASWLAFYEQSLKKQGIKTVYYDVNHLNKKAADYAQTMVDRQQNISDHDLAGKLYSESGNDYKSLFIKMFLAFSSFRMNTSARLANDLSVIEYWNTSTKEDKIIAMRSLAGYAVETFSFRYLSLLFSGLTSYLALMARGVEEDDEEEEKRKKNAFKGQATTGVVELLSPFPLLDKAVQLGVYHTLELLQSGTDEKDKINIYNVKNAEDFVSGLGLFGIAAKKALQIWELGKLSSTGEFVDDYGKTRYIKQDDRDIANALIYPTLLAGLGIIPPAEIKSITDKTIKGMKKDASTNNPNEWTPEEEKYLDELNQLDYIYKNYDLSDEEKDYIGLKMDERRLQINPERDLKMEKRVREEQKKEKELSKSLLEGYADREQMKRKDPALYKQNFGKQSEYYQDNLAERRVNKIWKKVKKGWD